MIENPNIFALLRNSTFEPEEIEAAIAKAESLLSNPASGFNICADPRVAAAQVKLLALGLRASGRPPVAPQEERQDLEYLIARDRRISTVLMGSGNRFAGFSIRGPETVQSEVINFLLNEFHPSNKSHCLIFGVPGCGKTYGVIGYACTLMNETRIWELDGVYRTGYKISQTLLSNLGKARDEELALLEKCKVLIIDDLGTLPEGRKADEFTAFFENLFHTRHMNNLPTLCTTNLSVAQVHEIYKERFVSRFNETGMMFVSPDGDYRKEMSNA